MMMGWWCEGVPAADSIVAASRFHFRYACAMVFRWKTWPDPDPDPDPLLFLWRIIIIIPLNQLALWVWLRFYWAHKRSKHFEVAPRIECFIGLSAVLSGMVLVLVPVLVSCLKNARFPFMRSVNISDYARPPRPIIANDNTNWESGGREVGKDSIPSAWESGYREISARAALCYA